MRWGVGTGTPGGYSGKGPETARRSARQIMAEMEQDPESSVRKLIDRSKSGDSEALSELVNLHEPMLVRWARKRLGYPLRTLDDTRDIIHDTYAVMLRKIEEFHYEDSRSFARWMRGIVTKIVLQKANGAQVRRRLSMPEEPKIQDYEMTPSTRATLEELTRYRYHILREFDRQERLIYRLRMRGFSSTQIATYTGLSGRTIRMKFSRTDARIRLRMKKFLDDQGAVDRGD